MSTKGVKTYLGASVYVDIDGDGFLLTTENGGPPYNVIFLGLSEVLGLIEFTKRYYQLPEKI